MLKNPHTRTNRMSKNILEPASSDTFALTQAVQERFIDTFNLYFRVHDVQLIPPVSLDRAMFLWRTMAVRFKNGDLRNTEDEREALKLVGDWIHEEHCKLTNQTYEPIQWGY